MSTPLNWITDRLPTRADADPHGDVVIATTKGDCWDMTHWYTVSKFTPWLPFKSPSTDPAPADLASALTTSQPRRIISITRTVLTSASQIIDAVADDGTAWWIASGKDEWTQLPALPNSDS